MLFVGQGTIKESSDPAERAQLRLNWDYPQSVNIVGEYWLGSQVVTIFETDDPTAVAQMDFAWMPHMEFKVTPAITAQTGMEMLREHLAHIAAEEGARQPA